MAYLVILHSRLSFLDYLEAANKIGLKTCFISQNSAFPDSLRDQFDLVIDDLDISEKSVLEALRKASILSEVKLFWTLNVTHIALCHKLNSEFLRLDGFSRTLANKTQNKEQMRLALEGTGFNPNYFLQPVNAQAQNPFRDQPCVIKPLLGYSSIGVELVRDPKKFTQAFEKSASVLESISNSISYFEPTEVCPRTHMLVEEFVDGKEYSLEMFAHQGEILCLAICAKSPMREPYFEEISYQMPASLTNAAKERLERAGCAIMKALGLRSGVAHLEVIDSPRGVIALDVGLRIGGAGLTHQLMKCSLGIDLVSACIREGLGHDPHLEIRPKKNHTAVLFLYQIGPGGDVEFIPSARELNLQSDTKLIDSKTFVHSGDHLKGYPSYSGLPGYALFEIESCSSDSISAASELIQLCAEHLTIRYREVNA